MAWLAATTLPASFLYSLNARKALSTPALWSLNPSADRFDASAMIARSREMGRNFSCSFVKLRVRVVISELIFFRGPEILSVKFPISVKVLSSAIATS